MLQRLSLLIYGTTVTDRSKHEGGKLAKLSRTSQPYLFFSHGCVVSDTSRFLLMILRQLPIQSVLRDQ